MPAPVGRFRRLELLRALRLVLSARRARGFRFGYLGVRPRFRRLGLDGVMLWKQKQHSRTRYEYGDMGWVLEDNAMTVRLIEMMGAMPSKTHTISRRVCLSPIGRWRVTPLRRYDSGVIA